MRQSKRLFTAMLAATLALGFWLPGNGTGFSTGLTTTIASEIPSLSAELNQLPPNLYAYDTSPLGDRTPVILVHGIGGEDLEDAFHWKSFLTFTETRPDFQKRFKIYLFKYDTVRSVPEGSASFRKTLKEFLAGTDAPIKVVGYSEGGLLVRNALQDPLINARVKKVITIATPFHGSPLATPQWFAQQLDTEPALSPMRMSQHFAYWVAYKKHPSFAADFQWDNFDSAISVDDYKKMNGRGEIDGFALASRDNFITYGSYFGQHVVDPTGELPKELGVTHALPKEKAQFKNLFRQNVLFSFVNKNLSKVTRVVTGKKPEKTIDDNLIAVALVPERAQNTMPTPDRAQNMAPALDMPPVGGMADMAPVATLPDMAPTPDVQPTAEALALRVEKTDVVEEDSDNTSLTAYNDGISPISSSLWLGRFMPNFSTLKHPVSKLWAALKSLKGTGQARLFAGIDHRNWMDGETRTETPAVRDLLNPDENPRTVFDWILFDLMS